MGFLWARSCATRRFYRRLVREGLPPEIARELAADYHGPNLREFLNRTGGEGTKASPA